MTAGTPSEQGEKARKRFRLACRMLRQAGRLDIADLPAPRRSESVIDWLVRAGLAQTPQQAAEGLLVAAGLRELRDELLGHLPPI